MRMLLFLMVLYRVLVTAQQLQGRTTPQVGVVHP
jgi:hypothetical protein